MSRRRVTVIVAALTALAAVNVVVFRDHYRDLASFTFDFPMAYYAFTSYWISSIQAGEWPHWIPYQSYGYPAALNPQLGLFYPPFWLFVVLKLPYTLYAANVVQVLHVLAGSIGFWLLGLRVTGGTSAALVGALCFAFFGGFYSNAQHPDILRAFVWTPWLLLGLILDERPVERRLVGRRVCTRLRTANVLLPLVVLLFITGSYPGVVVAAALALCAFVVAQGVALARADRRATDPRRSSVLRDTAWLASLAVVGAAMAAVYLLPTAFLSSELGGPRRDRLVTQFLTPGDFAHLLLPSNLLQQGDYSLQAMQLPVVALMFAPLARLRRSLVVPLVAMTAVGVFMSLDTFRPLTDRMAAAIPVLGASRLPSSDYRIFVYLPLMIVAVAGMDRAAREPARRRHALALAVTLGVLAFAISRVLNRPWVPDVVALQRHSIAYVMVGALGIVSYWLLASRWRRGWLLVIGLLCVATGMAATESMWRFWRDPIMERYLYDDQGRPLQKPDGSLVVRDVFRRRLNERPARLPDHPPLPDEPPVRYRWRGYIDGSFMTKDLGGMSTIARRAVEADERLTTFMALPGRVVGLACGAAVCSGPSVKDVAVMDLPVVGRSVDLARNSITYEVSLDAPSLVVENEAFVTGWSGACLTHAEALHPVAVNGALRGWALGAGAHRIRLEYATPWLSPGAAISTGALLLWVVGFGVWVRRADAGYELERR